MYVRLSDLLIDLKVARSDGSYKKMMAKYANPLVQILDEWLLLKPTETEQRDIFELLHRGGGRYRLPSSVHSMSILSGMNSLAEMTAPLPMLS